MAMVGRTLISGDATAGAHAARRACSVEKMLRGVPCTGTAEEDVAVARRTGVEETRLAGDPVGQR